MLLAAFVKPSGFCNSNAASPKKMRMDFQKNFEFLIDLLKNELWSEMVWASFVLHPKLALQNKMV